MRVQATAHPLAVRSAAHFAPYWIVGALIVIELLAILQLNGGRLIYTLDDPYIHLALSESIARGHYGINLGESSAPSSSILWPFLLAPFAGQPFHEYVPLAINLICAFASIVLLQLIIQRMVTAESAVAWPALLLVTLAAVGFNFVGLIFTGMEHSLQVLLALALLFGLLVAAEERRVTWWFLPVIVLGPTVRYESLSMSVAAVAFLALERRWALAVAGGIGAVLPLLGFAFYLHSLGLDPLPSSVLVKADVTPEGATLGDVATAMARSLLWSPGHFSKLILLAYAVLLTRRWVRGEGSVAERHLAAAGAIMAVAHLIGGRFGWFARYEVYVMASTTALMLYLWREVLYERVARVSRIRAKTWVVLTALLLCAPTLIGTVLTPLASNNIYQQQYQMARLISLLPSEQAVAVNDLGLASFDNDRHILDLWGLGSAEAGARRMAAEPGWMDDLTTRYGVRLAMIYGHWFKVEIPARWRWLGRLHLGRPRITPAASMVDFYAVDPAAEEELIEALDRLVPTLPDGVRFERPPGA